MEETTKCGDRRCTLEEAEVELRNYRTRYEMDTARSRSTNIDALDPTQTRIKTEIDEASELLASAKKKGADAWDEFKDGVQTILDKLSGSYQAPAEHVGKPH